MSIIKIPDELAREIDRLAGAKKGSAYAIDVLWKSAPSVTGDSRTLSISASVDVHDSPG